MGFQIMLIGLNQGKSKVGKDFYVANVLLGKKYNQDIARIFISKKTFDYLLEHSDTYMYQDISNFVSYDYDFKNHCLYFVLDLTSSIN